MIRKLLLIGAISISWIVPFNKPCFSLGYQNIYSEDGTKSAINIKIYPGRISTIDFSQTDSKITYIGIGDSSRVVWNLDRPIASGEAQSIFLRAIQEIEFEGATTTKITNLVVKTVDSKGHIQLYNFQLIHSAGGVTELGVNILSSPTPPISINLANGQSASLDDIEIGLEFAIARGYSPADDPIIKKIKNFLFIGRNTKGITLANAIEAASLDLNIITKLAELAFESYRGLPELPFEDDPPSSTNQFLDRLGISR